MVTDGGGKLYVTVLVVLVDAEFGFPAKSVTAPAGIEAITVPVCVIPLTATLYVVPLPDTTTVVAPAVPATVTLDFLNPTTGSLNVAVKLIGEVLVGFTWLVA